MPTIGQPEFFFRAFERDFCAIGLDRADFVRSGFPRERDVFFDVGFAAMAFGMFNGSASIRQASIAGPAQMRWIDPVNVAIAAEGKARTACEPRDRKHRADKLSDPP